MEIKKVYRKEDVSEGKDTKGMLRKQQVDKVERCSMVEKKKGLEVVERTNDVVDVFFF